MKKYFTAIAFALACAPGNPSTFDLQLTGDVAEQIRSGDVVRGAIDNAGNLAIEDAAWEITMTLPGVATGTVTLAGANAFAIVGKSAGFVLTTATGSCTIRIAPHENTNGTRVNATFDCEGLTSTDGTMHVDVPSGSFETVIDDTANDPGSVPPPFK